MEFWIKAAQLITSLSILIVLHELGHFIPARLFNTRVEKFYLFFDPWFSLFKLKKGETEYGIGWLPLGGYVKISGMIDESMDKEQLSKPAEDWEFRSKPAWQRLIIMLGGVTVNVIVGILLYIMIAGVWGSDIIKPEDVSSEGYAVSPYFEKYGLRDHDIVLELNGEKITDANSGNINKHLIVRGVTDMKVRHADGEIETIKFPDDIEYKILEHGSPLQEWTTPVIEDFSEDIDNAKKAGLQKGDSIIRVGDKEVQSLLDVRYYLSKKADKKVDLTVVRDGEEIVIEKVKVTGQGQLGFVTAVPKLKVTHIDYGFTASFSAGLAKGYWTIHDYVVQLKFLFTKKGASSLGGFGAIGGLFPSQWVWSRFWEMTALLSMILAVMNLLPIPALDGGHVMFLIYEMIAGKPPGEKFMEYAQITGIVLLLGLMLYANGNDIVKAFG